MRVKNAQMYLIGGGIGSMAAAAFMIRDAGVSGSNISILEAGSLSGGSLDGAGDSVKGYSLRGGRMLTSENYECTWDLFQSIPSLTNDGQSVFEETMEFNRRHHSHAQARLVDCRRARVPVSSMGFSMHDRAELLKLGSASEGELGASSITDWLSPHFFETAFWTMWCTTFAFQPWHSAVEFKRYLHRFLLEFSRIETLEGVKRTVYNQYDSLVLPLQKWLLSRGVRFIMDCWVTELGRRIENGEVRVTDFTCCVGGTVESTQVRDGDLVFLQNGSMTDSSSIGSMDRAPAKVTKSQSSGWTLWESLANSHSDFGRPSVFNGCVAQSCWHSFTVTLKNPSFFNEMHRFSGNQAGTGGLVTFKDSNSLMSIVLAHQPHFANQPDDVQVFWGYALHPDRVGNFVEKPLANCCGAEILKELCGHLQFDVEMLGAAICIPCRMPYITSMFMPRSLGDRPLPVPRSSQNLAFISQFVEIADDVVFTVEYSVRAAQMAVYELLQVERPIPEVTRHDESLRVQLDAIVKAFA